MTLEGTVGPQVSWYDHNIRQDLAHEKRFKAFTAWAAANDASAIEVKYYEIRASIVGRPLLDQVGPSELDDYFTLGGYDNNAWPRMATSLSSYLNDHDAYPLVAPRWR